MATLKYEMIIKEKLRFTEDGLKEAIINSLRESGGELVAFEYQPIRNTSTTVGESKCICEVNVPDLLVSVGIPTYQIILGDIQTVARETYPYFEIVSIPVEKMEYRN